MNERVYYEVDPFNRLIARTPPGRKSRIKKFRQVIYGRFRTGRDNAIFYEVNKSQGIDIPQKIRFSGDYSLTKEHDLIITLNKWNNQCEGNRLALKAKIIDAKSNEIALLVNSKLSENKGLAYIMRFYGSWQADKHNRLTFGVEKESNKIDPLILSGAWEINNNNEIVYNYGNDGQNLIFKGHWDINDRCRLKYVLGGKTDSGFNFRSSLGTLAPKGKKAYVAFDVGIGINGPRKPRRKVIFAGRWRIGAGKELILETSDIKESGLTLKFTKEMFNKKGIAYLESAVKDREFFTGGGIAFKW